MIRGNRLRRRFDLEADRLQSLNTNSAGGHIRQTVSLLDLLLDEQVIRVRPVELVSQTPFVTSEDLSGLQDAEDLTIDAFSAGSVASGLDGVDAVEAVVRELVQLHEVALHRLCKVAQTSGGIQLIAANDLILVKSDPGDLGPGEAGDVPHRTTDPTTDIEHAVVLPHAKSPGKVVLMSRDRLAKGLSLELVGEVKALPPSPLVEERRQLVIRVHQRRVGAIAVVLVVAVQVVVALDHLVHFDLPLLLLHCEGPEQLPGAPYRL